MGNTKLGAKDGFISKELRRYRKLKQAIPKWADPESLDLIYDKRNRINKNGFIVVVDHIVPICSNIVCGLHCIDNLQLISVSRNEAKSNYEWPDMPGENLDLFGVKDVEQYKLNL